MAPSHNRDMESLDKDHKENLSVAAKLRKGYFDSRLTPPPPPQAEQKNIFPSPQANKWGPNYFPKQVKLLCSTIKEMKNPFLEQNEDLLVLDTRNIVDSSVAESVVRQSARRSGRS